VPFEEAVRLYEELASGSLSSLAPIFDYKSDVSIERTMSVRAPRVTKAMNEIGISFIGAGNYAKGILLPAMADQKNTRLVSLVALTGASASHSAEKFKFEKAGTDVKEVFADPDVDIIFVTTRHDTHAQLTAEALLAGKAVWLEKPIGLSVEEVDRVADVVCNKNGFLTVGYNRRFSSHARAIRSAFEDRNGPLAIRYTVAAGPPPRDSWVTDPNEGGGRIIGEMCHFVDLCSYLVGSPPSSIYARALGRHPELDDSVVALLGFPDGSSATIEYLAHTDPDLPKERFEVSADDKSATCDNYKTTRITGEKDLKTFNQDKGQAAAIAEVIEAVRNGRPSPFTIFELVGVAKATFATLESIATGTEIRIGP
jgi:predicted dehydrogenase